MMLRRVLLFIRNNFDTLLALIVSIFAAFFGVFGGSEIALLAAIATTLGILSLGIIRDRYSREALQEDIQQVRQALEASSKKSTTAEQFFRTRTQVPHLRDRLTNTRTLDMLGASLVGVSISARGALQSLKASGGKMRLLMSNPQNELLQSYLAMTFWESDSGSAHTEQVNVALRSLVPLIGENTNGGSLEIRVTDDVIPFSYIGLDTLRPTGQIQIEFYLKKVPIDSNPLFILEAETDNRWFNEYRRQFESLWEHARELDEVQKQTFAAPIKPPARISAS